jgi:hypothetical protein
MGKRRSMSRLCSACLLPMLCLSATLFLRNEAQAQCSARDVMHHHPKFAAESSDVTPSTPVVSAIGTRIWKSVQTGTFANKGVLYGALEDADCGIGDTAEQILVAPGFALGGTAMKLDLVAVSVAELGMTRQSAALEDIYARAQKLGFMLAAAEVGPQLRLQYFDQPMGEFLNIAMAPIKTRSGAFGIFSVANGGAGLLLLGEELGANARYYPSSRFVFVRPIGIAGTH